MNRKKRIIAKAIFAVLTAVMLFACKPEGEKVTGVVLDHRELKADIGQTVTLTATVLPAEASDPKVSWEAVPEGFVELTADGALCTVKAVKAGKAAVLVTTEDGGFTAICTVTVLPVPAESIELNRDELNLIWGDPAADTATLTATVFPENAANKTVSWSVDKTGCIDLTDNKDGSCTLRARSVGNVTVTATAEDGSHTATCTVTVTPLAVESVALDRDRLNLILGKPAAETATLTAVVSPGNAVNKTVIWSAEPAEMVSLTDNGNGRCTVKALKVGETVVTATAADGGHVAKCTVTVTSVRAERVELNSYGVRLILGNKETLTATLTATVFPENAPNKAVSWSVEPENIVGLTVGEDSRCTIRALNVGHAVVTVTAEDGGETASCRVTVSPTYAESIALNRETVDLILSSEGGETATLTATVSPKNTTNKTVIWSAEPADAVKLTDNGNGSCTVEALKLGAVAVTATAADGSGHTATCTVTVSPVTAESVTLDRDNVDLILSSEGGETATLTATVFPENALNKTIIWSAEPADAVKLTDNGNGSCTVTALGGESAIVTAVSVANPAATAVCRVSFDYLYLTNTALIEAIDNRATDSKGTRISVGWTKESDGTVKLTPENLQKIRAVTELNLDCFDFPSEERLEDLGGIEYFTGLTYLSCGGNNLTTLDVSGCTALTELYCIWNRLTTLDVTNNTALTYLNCGDNNLTTLNVSGCAALTNLDCGNNNLTTLNVSGCTALTTLNCNDSNLTTLDVSGCAALTGLYVACSYGYGTLTTLDVSGCTALMTLDCHRNKLTTLDVSDCAALTNLDCGNNNLTTLNVSGCTALTTLNCNDSNLTTLDVSGCAALTGLYVASSYGYGNLTTLDVSGCTALTTLWCYGNKLWTLDIRPLSRLTSFMCTPQTESDGVTTRQLTLKLTREQKSKFDLQNGKYLKLEVYD